MLNLMLHRLQPYRGAVNFILAQLYTGVYNEAYNARHVDINRVRTINTFETCAGAESSVLLACAGHRSTGKECFPEGRKRAISACVFAV